MRNFRVIFRFLLCIICAFTASGNVILIGNNVSLTFEDIEANFAPSVKSSGMYGTLHLAEPLDACAPLLNKLVKSNLSNDPFVLIIRGGCSFDKKVRRAQDSGFKAAIVYDNAIGGLFPMSGYSAGIKIPALFVSKSSGETMAKYADSADLKVWIVPGFESSAWSVMAISFISLLTVSSMLATCFFVRRNGIVREQHGTARLREFNGMSRGLVKAMPSLTFTVVSEDNCTSSSCAICLEDYTFGEKLRVLPCRHKFHAKCVDRWLTTWRTFCPVCKRDVRTETGESPANESTPLLSRSSSVLSSFRSTSAVQIALPSGSFNRSSLDMRTMSSSQRSFGGYLISPSSLGFPSLSPLNSRYMSPYIPSPSNASSYIGSSHQHPNPLHCSESATSFSPFVSAQSLPGC